MKRKEIVKNSSELANLLAKSETGLSEAKVGDVRQLLKILVSFEAAGFKLRRRSIFTMLRKEAKEKAAKLK